MRYAVDMEMVTLDDEGYLVVLESETVGEFDTYDEARDHADEQNAKHEGFCTDSTWARFTFYATEPEPGPDLPDWA